MICSIAFVLLLTMSLASLLIYWHAVHEVQIELQAAAAVGTNTIRNAVDDAEEALNPQRQLQLLVADFNGERHLRVILLNNSGKVLAQSEPLQPPEPVPEWFYRLLSRHELSQRIALPPPFAGIGAIILQTDSRNEVSEVWSDVLLMLTILLIFCGANAVFVLWVIGQALRPLDEISASMTSVGAGNYGRRVTAAGPRELATLAHGFNQMAQQLESAEDRRRRLERQLLAVQDEERAELARDLHDEVGPLLFAVGVDLSVLQQDEAIRATPLAARVTDLRNSITRIYAEIKAILGRLRPTTLIDLGLAQAVENLLLFWRARYPNVQFHCQLPVEGFGLEVDDVIYHVVMEGLSNALRHGNPSHIRIQLICSDEYIVTTIADDGRGFAQNWRTHGFGIGSMEQRLSALGGELQVSNGSAGGALITARIPWSPTELPTTQSESQAPSLSL